MQAEYGILNDMVEDAEGRWWRVGSIDTDDSYTRALAEEPDVHTATDVRFSFDLVCRVGPGHTLPNVDQIVQRVIRSITLGGSRLPQ